MNPNIDLKAAAEKKLRAMERELRILCRIHWDAPLLPLDQPYQRGWERWFEWTPESQIRDDAARLPGLMKAMQKREVSRWLDFRSYSWKQRKQVPMPHEIPQWSLWRFIELKLPPELWGYFETEPHGPLSQPGHLQYLRQIRWGGLVSFRHPQWLVSRFGPHWITHIKVAMPEVESRIASIEGWMERTRGWQKLHRLHGHHQWHGDKRRDKLLADLHRRETLDEVHAWQKGAEPSALFSLLLSLPFAGMPACHQTHDGRPVRLLNHSRPPRRCSEKAQDRRRPLTRKIPTARESVAGASRASPSQVRPVPPPV